METSYSIAEHDYNNVEIGVRTMPFDFDIESRIRKRTLFVFLFPFTRLTFNRVARHIRILVISKGKYIDDIFTPTRSIATRDRNVFLPCLAA